MTGIPPAAPDRGERSGYRHPETAYEWTNAVHMRKGRERLEGPRLPNRLHGTAFALWDRAKMAAGVLTCNPSHAGLAEDLGLSTSGVDRHLSEMESLGWIVRERGGPRRNTSYHLVIPASVHLPVGVPPSVGVHPSADQVPPPVGVGTPTGGGTAPPPVGDEVPSEVLTQVPNEVGLLAFRNAGAGARELPPPPRSITEERRDTYVGVFDGMGRGKPNNVDKPADPLAEYAHLFSDWSRTQLRRRCAVEVARDPDPDHNPDGSIDALVLSIAQLYTLAARKGRRKETKAGFRDFVREFNEAATDDGIPEVATIRSLLGFEAA